MKKNTLARSTGIVASSTLLSRILGFIRDMLIAKYFGASGSLDGFFVAFRIPNLFRRLVAEGALTISFIPVYTEYLVHQGEEEALKLAQKTLTILTLVLLLIVGIGILFSPEIVRLFAYGFISPEKISLTIDLNRIMFPYLFLVGLVAFCMGVLNSHGYFFAPAVSPVLLNVGFIIGTVFFSAYFSEPLYGLAYGVIFGGVLQVLTQVPYMIRSGFRIRVSFDLAHPGIRRIFRLIAPALFGIAVYQINILMSTILASMLAPGSISYLYYSDRLTEIILGVFIVSIGNVLLPEMSRISAKEDMESLRALYTRSISAALFLAIPAGIALMAAGTPIISVLFLRDKFTFAHTLMTDKALFYSSMGIASIAVLRITTPTFYSLKDTKVPVISSAVSFVLNISLGYLLMQTSLIHGGLALANTIANTVQMIILLVWLQRKIGRLEGRDLILPALKFLSAGLVMGLAVHLLASLADWEHDPFLHRIAILVLIVALGGGIYFLVCSLLSVREINYLRDRVLKRLWAKIRRRS